MCARTAKELAFFLVLVLLTAAPAPAFGPVNARLHGFGGAGVAVVTRDGQTALAVNPAAPAFLKQYQLHLNINRGDRIETGETNDTFDLTDHPVSWGGGLEGYVPFPWVTLFGGAGYESETIDWQEVYPGEGVITWGDGDARSTTINLGAAGAVHDMVALGGQLLSFRCSQEEEGRGWSHDDSDSFRSGEVGLLVATPARVNLGLTWRSGDSNDEERFSERAKGINELLRVGAAYQDDEGNWLVGVEYVDQRPLSLGEPVYWSHRGFEEGAQLGEERFHLYGEYRFDSLGVRAGLCRSRTDETVPANDDNGGPMFDYGFDVDHLVVSLGLSGRISDRLGWDFFLQRTTGDSQCRRDDLTWYRYDYEDKGLLIGYGVTFLW